MEHKTIEAWKQHRTGTEADLGSVCLWLVHIESGRYLDDEGRYCGMATFYEFNAIEEAHNRKDELLELFPFAAVLVGRPDDPMTPKFTSPKIGEFTKEKRRWLSWKSFGYLKRKLRPEPKLHIFDPHKDPSVKP